MSDNTPRDIGDAGQWVTALRSLDDSVEKMTIADIQLVARLSLTGPRTPEEGLRVLADPGLRQLLVRTWRDDPPDDDLRTTLQQDVVGRDLLALVASTDAPMAPSMWSRLTAAFAHQLAFTPLRPVSVGGVPRDPNASRFKDQVTMTMRARIAGGGRVTLRKTGADRWIVTVFKRVESGDVLVITWPDDQHQLIQLEAGDHSAGLALGELISPAEDFVPEQVYLGQPPWTSIDD